MLIDENMDEEGYERGAHPLVVLAVMCDMVGKRMLLQCVVYVGFMLGLRI